MSSVAVAAVGAVGVWMGLAATAVPTVDLGDTTNDVVVASTGTENAVVDVEWRLSPDGDVTVWATIGFDPLSETMNAETATVIIELWCDARLRTEGCGYRGPRPARSSSSKTATSRSAPTAPWRKGCPHARSSS